MLIRPSHSWLAGIFSTTFGNVVRCAGYDVFRCMPNLQKHVRAPAKPACMHCGTRACASCLLMPHLSGCHLLGILPQAA